MEWQPGLPRGWNGWWTFQPGLLTAFPQGELRRQTEPWGLNPAIGAGSGHIAGVKLVSTQARIPCAAGVTRENSCAGSARRRV